MLEIKKKKLCVLRVVGVGGAGAVGGGRGTPGVGVQPALVWVRV